MRRRVSIYKVPPLRRSSDRRGLKGTYGHACDHPAFDDVKQQQRRILHTSTTLREKARDACTPPLSQKPYLPLGSLRTQMLYPRSEDELPAPPSSLLEGILERVQLGYLCGRSGGLEETRDWQDELSLGEQQARERGRSFLSSSFSGPSRLRPPCYAFFYWHREKTLH